MFFGKLARVVTQTLRTLVDTHICPGNAEQVVDVTEWFSFTASQVPRNTEKLHGAPQDLATSAQGQNFPVLPLW